MPATICAFLLLTVVPGAEPAGFASVTDPICETSVADSGLVREPASGEFVFTTPAPIVVGHVCRVPAPLLYVDTNYTMRWYTAANAAFNTQPYNYLTQFDYPWHPIPRCAACAAVGAVGDAAPPPHALLAPSVSEDGTRESGMVTNRPSAIRDVD